MSLPKPYSVYGLTFTLIFVTFFILYLFPLGFVFGTSSYWVAQDQDISQYISGFNAYLNTPWQLPLLYIKGVNWPVGTMVTFMDGVPLYAFILKLILPYNILPYSPYGFYVSLCFLLQGVAAWLFVKLWKVDSWVLFVCMISFLITFPALLFRLGHISLMAHWLIVFSLYLYAYGSIRKELCSISWAVLLFVSFYLNVYIFVMVFAVFFADHVRVLSKYRSVVVYKFFIATLPLVGSLFVFLLPMPGEGKTTAEGFGLYSMNILEPISGGKYTPWVYERGTVGQYEGFNYVGLGSILLFLIATYLHIKYDNVKSNLLKSWPIITTLCFFVIYSLSNEIYFGKKLLLSYSLPDFFSYITDTLRASGRFFWPVGYSLLILSFFTIHKAGWGDRFPLKVFLLFLLCFQILDIRPYIIEARATVREPGNEIVNFGHFDSVINQNSVERIYYYPYFGCEKSYVMHTLMPVMLYASINDIDINTGYISRYVRDCSDIVSEIELSDVSDSIYFFSKIDYEEVEDFKSYFPEKNGLSCQSVLHWHICNQITKSDE